MGNKCLDCTALTLTIIGAINWGLIGFFRFDLVAFLFGDMSWLSRVVYALVGLCGLYMLAFYRHCGRDILQFLLIIYTRKERPGYGIRHNLTFYKW